MKKLAEIANILYGTMQTETDYSKTYPRVTAYTKRITIKEINFSMKATVANCGRIILKLLLIRTEVSPTRFTLWRGN